MNNIYKILASAFCLLSSFSMFSQDIEIRVVHNGDGEMSVESRYVGTGTPPQAGAEAFVDFTMDLRWPVSGDINLSAIDNTAGYGISKVGGEITDNAEELQQFALDDGLAIMPTSWVTGEWVEIFKVTDINYDNGGEEVFVAPLGTNPNQPDNIPNVSLGSGAFDGPPAINGSAILPIKLNRFTATKRERSVNLDWSTSSEINGSHFDVQRSRDLSTWMTVGTVDAVGESTSLQEYQLVDKDLPLSTRSSKTFYYRLNMVDNDGSSELSEIRTVRFDQDGADFIVYPNPSINEVFVNLSSITAETGPATMHVINMKGERVKEVTLSTNDDVSVDISNITSGVYYFVVNQGAETFTQKVIKID